MSNFELRMSYKMTCCQSAGGCFQFLWWEYLYVYVWITNGTFFHALF